MMRPRSARLRSIALLKKPTILLSHKQFFTPHFKMGGEITIEVWHLVLLFHKRTKCHICGENFVTLTHTRHLNRSDHWV